VFSKKKIEKRPGRLWGDHLRQKTNKKKEGGEGEKKEGGGPTRPKEHWVSKNKAPEERGIASNKEGATRTVFPPRKVTNELYKQKKRFIGWLIKNCGGNNHKNWRTGTL